MKNRSAFVRNSAVTTTAIALSAFAGLFLSLLLGAGVALAASQTFGAGSATFQVPAGVTQIEIEVWGGGGSGGTGAKIGNANISGFGGGGAGYAEKIINVNPGDTVSMSVAHGGDSEGAGGQASTVSVDGVNLGAGGGGAGMSGVAQYGCQGDAGAAGGGPNGGLGGNFDASQCAGGSSVYGEAGGQGGTGFGGDVNAKGNDGGPFAMSPDGQNPYASSGGGSPNGGAGGARGRCGRDGTCPGSVPGSDWAQDGNAPGGGGGGSDVATGGIGGDGLVRISYVTPSAPVTPVTTQYALTVSVTGSGSVTSNTGGINCPNGACSANYNAGTTVTLTATASSGYTFSSWGGACNGTNGTVCATTVNGNSSVTATFTQNSPSQPQPLVNGITYDSVPSTVQVGQVFNVVVTNTGTKTWGPAHQLGLSSDDLTTNYVFDNLGSPNPVAPNAPAETVSFTAPSVPGTYVIRAVEQNVEWFGTNQTILVTAAPAPATPAIYELKVAIIGSGTVTSADGGINCPTGNCTYFYNAGSNVTLTATPAAGYVFNSWSNACSPTTVVVCSLVSLGSYTDVTAVFTAISTPPPSNQSTVSVNIVGSGTVTSNTGGINCPNGACSAVYTNGSTVTFTAVASPGYTFVGWNACPGNGTCTITVGSNTTVTATFVSNGGTPPPATQYTLTVSVVGSGSVTSNIGGINCPSANCSAVYNSGTTIALTATPTPNSGFTFSGWGGGACVGNTTTTCTVNLTSNTAVTAIFIQNSGNGSGGALNASCTVNPTAAYQGSPVVWTANPSGGVSPYTYSWSGDDSLSGATQSITHSYFTLGTFNTQVIVTSSDAQSVTRTCTVTVLAPISGGGGNGGGGGLNQPDVSLINQTNETGSLASAGVISLTQVPYTGLTDYPSWVYFLIGLGFLSLLSSAGFVVFEKLKAKGQF